MNMKGELRRQIENPSLLQIANVGNAVAALSECINNMDNNRIDIVITIMVHGKEYYFLFLRALSCFL